MITNNELKIIDPNYFNIIQLGPFAIYIQSKNTGHYWGILLSKYPTFRNFQIHHKHHSHNEYHRHSDASSIKAAIEHIKDHDAFHINKKKNN